MKVKVSRIDLNPRDIPTEKIVGFHLTFLNGRTTYVETTVDVALEDDAAIDKAFEDLQDEIQIRKSTTGSLPALLGKEWFVDEEGIPNLEEVESE